MTDSLVLNLLRDALDRCIVVTAEVTAEPAVDVFLRHPALLWRGCELFCINTNDVYAALLFERKDSTGMDIAPSFIKIKINEADTLLTIDAKTHTHWIIRNAGL